jgi:hypothetical protein
MDTYARKNGQYHFVLCLNNYFILWFLFGHFYSQKKNTVCGGHVCDLPSVPKQVDNFILMTLETFIESCQDFPILHLYWWSSTKLTVHVIK